MQEQQTVTAKRTIFYDLHRRLGAKMGLFAGFEMPIQYPKGIVHEHMAVRQWVGVFDVSHMGEFRVWGEEALAFLQFVTVNDVSRLTPGRAQYSVMCYPDGGIVDDLLVYHCGDYYMLVVNAATTQKDFTWLQQQATQFRVELEDVSERTHLLAVQGPKSAEALQPLTELPLLELPYYHHRRAELAGVPMLISRTGYTGELGYELYFEGDQATAEHVWEELFRAGAPVGIEPAGLGARDTLRLEKGYCLYGNDIDETTNPLEAGLGWITKLDKGEFIGREALLRVKQEGLKRRLVGFRTESERAIPRPGYAIVEGQEFIGRVTSGNISPVLRCGIGMGYVPATAAEPGTRLEIVGHGGRRFAAEVVKLPFV
ncbi:MAG: glycine cleavage system aminomethyltransferase GcvT [Candidatus Kapabacteria bacterium]|nr:glycine cleavage system aminomethyltransferase GcvT [Candidatus Kapabacteria bacterium]MDW8012029.1 glycine cleavage system aminomethyltransferase GcvT [Bacteroidota bacterium]